MAHSVELLMTGFVTHDVKRFVIERPEGFEHQPGQGVELFIDEPGWEEQGRPFTPTSLSDARALEFTIKGYPEHQGVTQKLHGLRPGARLRISDPFGTITYRGPGTFIAGGAGMTPFLAIVRHQAAEGKLTGHSLLFSNKTPADILCEKELRHYFGDRALFLCTRETGPGCSGERIDREFLTKHIQDFDQHFYTCGPPKFVEAVNTALRELGASPDALVFER